MVHDEPIGNKTQILVFEIGKKHARSSVLNPPSLTGLMIYISAGELLSVFFISNRLKNTTLKINSVG